MWRTRIKERFVLSLEIGSVFLILSGILNVVLILLFFRSCSTIKELRITDKIKLFCLFEIMSFEEVTLYALAYMEALEARQKGEDWRSINYDEIVKRCRNTLKGIEIEAKKKRNEK